MHRCLQLGLTVHNNLTIFNLDYIIWNKRKHGLRLLLYKNNI